MFSVALLLLRLASWPAVAEYKWGGYMKDLYARGRGPFSRQLYDYNLTRFRLGFDTSDEIAGGVSLKTYLDYDQEFRTGSYFLLPEFSNAGLSVPGGYPDYDQVLSSGPAYDYRHGVYRGWAGLATETGVARFGRQRIAWGAGRIWNPTDVLNPYQPLTLERDERTGVNALYLRQALGVLAQAEAAYVPEHDWVATNLLGRLRGNWLGVDASMMGGKLAGDASATIVGSDAAYDLGGGNLHGEWSYTRQPATISYWRALAGYEYSFSASPPVAWLKNVWALAEFYHNGAGALDPRRYDVAAALSGAAQSLGRDYVGVGLRKELHPLLTVELYDLVNLHDSSHFLGPSADWNALPNLHLTLGAHRFSGAPSSEFGRPANIGYAQAQLFF